MADTDGLADQFEAKRGHLRGVAYRMLGSLAEADDAVQEAWLRLSRSGGGHVDNLGAWLTDRHRNEWRGCGEIVEAAGKPR